VKERQTTLQELITSIKAKRQNANLSSAIRLFILDHFAASKATNAKRMKEESPGVEGPGL
jgi:predicted DNA-binding ribbon-helix-helix protein